MWNAVSPPIGELRAYDQRHAWSMALRHQGIGCTVIAPWLGHGPVETTNIHLRADLRIRQQAMEKPRPLGVEPGPFRPTDDLLAFLEAP